MIYYDSSEMKRSRFMFALQAAFEYLIAILMVDGTILAELTGALGFTDAQTGVLYSFISLGCLFQIVSIFFRRGSVKKFVIFMSILNQVLFMLLYVIPDFPVSEGLRRIVFIVFIVCAYAGLYIANPKVSYWRMSLVEVNRRGRYNGWMQIISLILGMFFSTVMGSLVDSYKAADNLPAVFRICAITIFGLMIIHQLILVSIVELPKNEEESGSAIKNILGVAKNKKVWILVIAFVLWNIAQYSAMPFYKTYQLNELGMSQTSVNILAFLVGGIVQMVTALPIGAVADRFSFPKMLIMCLVAMFFRAFVVIFATPENGLLLFALYYSFNAITANGALCALMNIVFTNVPENMRADTYAFCQSVGGVCGFGTTIVLSGLVDSIQASGNTFLGMNVYAQQVVSIISCIFTLVCIAYIIFVIEKKQGKQN